MKKIIYAVVLGILTFNAAAQVNVDLKPQVKSPEVNKFEQYMNMPVNLVSGTPQVSIPIYTLEYGGMTLPISLEYDASGVKVESIASCVGQNWSLNVGGAVSRIIKGAPDEGNPYVNTDPIAKFLECDGYYQDYGLSNLESMLNSFAAPQQVTHNITSPRYTAFNYFTNNVYNGNIDSQPDLFYFSTPQGGSKFVFNNQRQIVYTENTDFIIKENDIPNFVFQNDFKSWSATSPAGIKYKFGLDSGSQFGENNAVERSCGGPVGEFINKYIVNSWFLTEISNFQNNKKINLTYSNQKYKVINNQQMSHSTKTNNQFVGWVLTGDEASQYNGYVSANSGNFAKKYLQNNIETKLIKKIVAGNISIDFIYNQRLDLDIDTYGSADKLVQIVINEINADQNITKCIKNIAFEYSENSSTDTFQINYPGFFGIEKRFFLNKIIESSANGSVLKPYSFTYNETHLPYRLSYAQDKWGFYNGKDDNKSLFPPFSFFDINSVFAQRDVNIDYAKAGSLVSITYPTKGTVNFEYEAHKAAEPTGYLYNHIPVATKCDIQPQPNGLFSSPSNTDFFYYDLLPNQILSLSSSMMFPAPMISLGDYCFNNNIGALVAAEITDTTNNAVIEIIQYPYRYNGTKQIYIDPAKFVQGRQYKLKVNGSQCNHNMTKVYVHNITPIYDVGGLRVKKIIHRNFDNSIAKEQNYNYFEPNVVANPIKSKKFSYNFYDSYDSMMGILSNSNINYFKNMIDAWGPNQYAMGQYYFISTGADSYDVNFKGPQISYGSVIETDGNGSTISIFSKYKSYFQLNGFQEPRVFPAPPLFQSTMAGTMQHEIQKNETGIDIKHKYIDYNYTTTDVNVMGVSIQKMNDLAVYPFYSYRIRGQIKTLKKETDQVITSTGTIETTKEYEYLGNNHNNPTSIKTTDSKGQVSETKLYYPTDLLTEPFMQNLKQQNRISIPVKTEKFIAGNKVYEQKTTFANDTSTQGLVQTKSGYAAKFPNSLPNIAGIGQLEKKVTTDLYDVAGNIQQYTPENGIPVSIVWGYNQTLPIAKLENVDYASVAPYIANLQTISNASNSEGLLLTALNDLRTTFPNAMITTYTHKPLIGVSTITDPKGDIITYTYDSFGRLQYVTDKNGNKLSENQYNYKP